MDNEVQKLVEFLSVSQILENPPSEESLLIGDNHICKGSVSVIGGPPGVGKSRLTTALAVAGASGEDWFGLTTHRRFKTMILQAENGPRRIYEEYSDLCRLELDDHVRVSLPPEFGIRLDHIPFRNQLNQAIEDFQPDVFILDPWNAAVADDKAKDFRETFDLLRSLIGTTEDSPALVIVHHTRKPKDNERANGRALLNTLAGSYVFASVPRAAFVLLSASNDPEDERVVFTCCKNNDGELGSPSAWWRRNGLFQSVENFDWKTFNGESNSKAASGFGKFETILESNSMSRKNLAESLKNQYGMGRSTAYEKIKKYLNEVKIVESENGIVELA